MTSKVPEAGPARDHLIADYGGVSFLIDRGQCSSSLFLDRVRPIDHPIRYLSSSVEYRGTQLIVLDLDAWLRETFALPGVPEFHVALIADVRTFSAEHRVALSAESHAHGPALDDARVAFRLTSHVEIVRVRVETLRPAPPALRTRLRSAGILGCRFATPSSIHYSLDVEMILFNILGLRKELVGVA